VDLAAASDCGRGPEGPVCRSVGYRCVRGGCAAHYRQGPSRTWSEADRRNVAAFQRAQGWSGPDADGFPGPETWRRLFP
ncbi:peptidoglycan-binding protein, partial [Streptomyces sp. NPDC059506]|uniref:peptidoglycan-binding protein n=1 Tax=Streptomyces sp. NPDC059506 TaxID=3347751 RepID=UPI0036882EF5